MVLDMKWSLYLFVGLSVLFSNPSFSQVNLQNGAAQISLPLYNYSDAGNRLNLGVSLNYTDGSGLKVSEMASSVGTGWALACGGMIARIQHGEPDDQPEGPVYSYDGNGYFNYMNHYYPAGYMYTSYSPSETIYDDAGYSIFQKSLPIGFSAGWFKAGPQLLADREQDEFAFSFNGQSGRFVIGKNKQIKSLVDSKLKIEMTETQMPNVQTTISQFTITDQTGMKFVFKDLGMDYVLRYNDLRTIQPTNGDVKDAFSNFKFPDYKNCGNCADNVINVIKGQPMTTYTVDKWYLSQIINPFTNKQITFNYSTYEEDIDADKFMTYSTGNGHGTVTVLWKRYKYIDKRLQSVVLSEAERIDLTYSGSPRLDLPKENTLDQLQVSYNGTPVTTWKFGYGYLVGIDSRLMAPTDAYTDQELQYARLCLLSVQKTGLNNTSEPPYKFGYNMGGDNGVPNDIVPPMFSIFQDHYGYYNLGRLPLPFAEGTATSFYSLANLKTLLINNSICGTDGTKCDFKAPLSSVAKNGIIKSITYPMGGVLTYSYEPNQTPTGQIGGVRVSSTSTYDGIDHANDIVKQYKYVKEDGSSSGWGAEDHNYVETVPIVINTSCGGDMGPSLQVKELATNYIQNGFSTGVFGFAGGAFLDGAITSTMEGNMIGAVAAVIIDLLSSPNSTYTLTEYKNRSAVADNPLPWGYARTEVVDMLGQGTAGKTAYEFSSPIADRPIDIQSPSVLNSSRPRCADFTYGAIKAVTVYDKNGNKIKKTINNYHFIANPYVDNNFLSKSWTATSQFYGCAMTYNALGSSSNVQQETYYPLTGHNELYSTDEIMYNDQQQTMTTTTSYEYDNNFQVSHKWFYNSKGEKVETFYHHPYDYPSATDPVSTMSASSNIINPVLASETYINKGAIQYLVAASSSAFDRFPNGDIKPKFSYAFQSVQPVNAASLLPFDQSVVLRDPAYLKQVSSYNYDFNGNIVQMITGGNHITSSMYDYGGKLLVAIASNASYDDIGYTSFEAEGGKTGSWVNSAAIVIDDARTGNKCFNLSTSSNPSGGGFGFSGTNSGLTYIVSYWSKNGSGCVNAYRSGQPILTTCQGSSGWKQGATVNGWTYYEVQIPNTDKIGISGTGLIDEVRVYPVGAQMTTATYTPLVGKTSECDASGRVTYYTYDDLGRLVKVGDDQRNVIRTYEYNYKQ